MKGLRTLHWFRNDLRLDDNRALREALRGADQTGFLYVLDPALLGAAGAPRPGAKRRAFLADCLRQLSRDLVARGGELMLVEGEAAVVVPAVAAQLGVARVTFGRDYSPLAKRRDDAVVRELLGRGIEAVSSKDRVVLESDQVLTGKGAAFRVFTPYRNAWRRQLADDPNAGATVDAPQTLSSPPKPSLQDLTVLDLEAALARINPSKATVSVAGGEAAAQSLLKGFLGDALAGYSVGRDFAAEEGTSRLSAYLRFGVISARRCLAAAGEAVGEDGKEGGAVWLDQLIWREFYLAILANYPHVLTEPFRPQTKAVRWDDDDELFNAWCEGRTGYPFVDAGMRQLVSEGWMHNRARMVTASFLVKDLLIDWRRGERFFAEHLIDCEPASNNGGWQWCASTGTDAQPYFRVFNPTRQGQRFDPRGEYVRRWVPELSRVPDKFIHEPWKAPGLGNSYPGPIVEHAQRRLLAIKRFEQAAWQFAQTERETDHA